MSYVCIIGIICYCAIDVPDNTFLCPMSDFEMKPNIEKYILTFIVDNALIMVIFLQSRKHVSWAATYCFQSTTYL